MKLIAITIAVACTAFPGLVVAGQTGSERVRVPVYSRNVPFLDMTVGSSGPLSMFIDTGAGGIRIHPGNVKDSDIEHTGNRNQVMYGDGNAGIEGEVVLGEVRIGDFVVPGKTPFQAISKHVCKQGYEDRCKRTGSKHGGAGTIGLGIFHYSDLKKKMHKNDSPVFNPLIQQGSFSYILKVPRNDNKKGALIINPTPQEKSRFTLIPLAPGNGQRVPICINRYCFEAVLDTGTVGNNIPIATQKDVRQLGLPVHADKIAEGTSIPITLGTGRNALSLNVMAGKKAANYRIADKENGRGLLGIDIFRYIDVLYDFEAGVIGVALKE